MKEKKTLFKLSSIAEKFLYFDSPVRVDEFGHDKIRKYTSIFTKFSFIIDHSLLKIHFIVVLIRLQRHTKEFLYIIVYFEKNFPMYLMTLHCLKHFELGVSEIHYHMLSIEYDALNIYNSFTGTHNLFRLQLCV